MLVIKTRKEHGRTVRAQERPIALREMGRSMAPDDFIKNAEFFDCQIGEWPNPASSPFKWNNIRLRVAATLLGHSLLPELCASHRCSTQLEVDSIVSSKKITEVECKEPR